MPTSRRLEREEVYGVIATDAPPAPPDPETDINVVRGLKWAIGGTIAGSVFALGWFFYRLFSPIEGADGAVGGIGEYIVVPMLAILYAVIGAIAGGCLGMAVGLVFMGIAALKEARERQEEEEDEPVTHSVRRSLRGQY